MPEGEILIAGIEPIRGSGTFALIALLVGQFEDDLQARHSADRCRYCRTRTLIGTLEVDDATLRRRVTRFRRKVANEFDRRHGLSLHSEAVVQITQVAGIRRLNPAIRLVRPDDIGSECREDSEQASRQRGRSLDSRASSRA